MPEDAEKHEPGQLAPAEELAVEDLPGESAEETDVSLLGDIETLVEDGKTYAAAELAYQKTRLAFAGEKAKSAAIFTGIAALFVVMAVVALVLGAVLALTPLLGALGATAAVFLALLLIAGGLVMAAKAKLRGLMRAFESDDDEQA